MKYAFIDYMRNIYFGQFSYLFSHQVCYVHMNLEEFYQGNTQLLPEKMDMATDTKLPQYFIQSWQLVYMRSGAYCVFHSWEIIDHLSGTSAKSNLYAAQAMQ